MLKIQRNNGLDFLLYREGSGNTVEIFDIAVMSERRKGIGTRMIRELVSRVGKEADSIFAIARNSNKKANAFYRHNGFRVVARLPEFYADEDAIIYSKRV